jgi:enoyl-CoA hydratase/carnithine racemase
MATSPSQSAPEAASRSSPPTKPEAAGSGHGLIGLTLAEGIADLVLRREEARNAISPALLAELESTLAAVEGADNLKVLVLRGEGKTFCVGADLRAVEALAPGETQAFFARGRDFICRLERLNVLTVAAVNGLALGGGFELALACDVRWAHARAVFGFPEGELGLVPGWGGVRLLRRHLPSSLALELLSRGNRLGASAAHASGLVSRVFEGNDFEGQVRAALEAFRASDAAVLRSIKQLWLEGGRDGGDRWDAAEAAAFDALWSRRGARFAKPDERKS